MRTSLVSMWLAAALMSSTALGGARAESRLALVIGNSAYQAVSELPNPANDAKAVAELLTAAGFEVTAAPDLGQAEMRRAVGEFAGKVAEKGADSVALVFYAGHGVQVDGENFLVPVDARIGREADVPLQAMRLADVMNALAAVPSRSRIVLLDACRNNPFSEINKVAGHGLAIVDAPSGSIVSYSTSPGSEAEDGSGANSPYTTALLSVAREPGLPIEQAFKKMRYSVHQSTGGRQTPWESSSLTGDFAFFPGAAGTPTADAGRKPEPRQGGTAVQQVSTAAPRTFTRTVDSWKGELRKKSQGEAYEVVIREDAVEAYQAYLQVFGTAPQASRVRELVDRRTQMVAWYTAVTIDTPAAYRLFATRFPGSDLGATAERLFSRATFRSAMLDPNFLAAANVCTAPVAPVTPKLTPKRERRAEPEKKTRRAERSEPDEKPSKKGRRTVVRNDGPPPSSSSGGGGIPPEVIGIGIGVGMGMMGSRHHGSVGPTGGGGHSHGPVGHSHGPVGGSGPGPVRTGPMGGGMGLR